MRQTTRPSPPPAAGRSHGSAYVFVLGITLIVTVLGMGALTLTRVTARTTADGNDWETAGALAFSATEQAISYLNAAAAANPTGWRTSYVNKQTAFTQTVGRGQFYWALKDEVDNQLGTEYLHAFRIYGIGKVGTVTRVYSVQVSPGGSPLDVLRTAVHSSGAVTLAGIVQAANGPISSNGNVSLSGTVNGAIEAASISGSASGTRTVTAPSPAKRMPPSTVYDSLLPLATAINYSAISGRKMDKCLLSPSSNPYGATNPNGIYVIVMPGNETLTITNCRIVGTLLVSGNKAIVTVEGPVLWETGPARTPLLVVSAKQATLTLNGYSTWLSESSAGVNFNPASTPFAGDSNSNQTDDFPPQYRGIIHVATEGIGTVNLNANTYLNGTLIADCSVKTATMFTGVQDPAFYKNPPFGYASGDVLTAVPGTWRWDTLP